MHSQAIDHGDGHMDRRTSVAICHAIGERLRRDFSPAATVPSRLQMLLDEMEQQDNARDR